jgi:hypothetical protein
VCFFAPAVSDNRAPLLFVLAAALLAARGGAAVFLGAFATARSPVFAPSLLATLGRVVRKAPRVVMRLLRARRDCGVSGDERDEEQRLKKFATHGQ